MAPYMSRLWTEQGDRGGPPNRPRSPRALHYRELAERFRAMSKAAETDIAAADFGALAHRYEELAAYVEAMETKSGAPDADRS
jgi:hypothetical protein